MSDARLISSDLYRCVETAELIGDSVGLLPEFDMRLRELGLGNAEGCQRDNALALFPGLANLWDYPDVSPAPNSEKPCQLQERISDFLHNGLAAEQQPIIVVAHAGPILTMIALAGHHTMKSAQNLSLANGSICKCKLDNNKLDVLFFNMTEHLHDEHRQDNVIAYQR